MNRLFLKIFVLLALVVFGSGALVIGYFDFSVFPSENRQLEADLGPGVRALAERIERGEDVGEVVRDARNRVGDAVAVVPLSLVPLTAAELDRLTAGEVVISGDGPRRSAWARVGDQDRVVEFVMIAMQDSRVQWSGLADSERLGRPPTAAEASGLSELDRARLQWRAVAIDRGTVVRQVGDELRVIDLPAFLKSREVVTGLTLLGTALVILVSLLPVRRELLALDRGARELRQGDLSARIPVRPRAGPVGQVSLQVNAMADRVQTLVGSHEELLRSVSHELQTPLARLLFSIDALEQDPERTTELLGGMRLTVDEMRVLAEEVLRFNKLGSVPETLDEREPVDLVELAGDVALTFEGAEVVAPTGSAFVDGDPRLLYRALRNLVENAVVYATPPILRVVESADAVSVHVDDEGPGVPESERARVFDPFHRVEGSRARATGGTGLGLAIVSRVAQRHGGSVEVGTSPEGGARFTLTVPKGSSARG